MEYLEQYNFDLQYHPGKANVVADALSRKACCTLACLVHDDWEALRILTDFGLEMVEDQGYATLFSLEAQPDMIARVIDAQQGSARSQKLIERTKQEGSSVWLVGAGGELRYHCRLYV